MTIECKLCTASIYAPRNTRIHIIRHLCCDFFCMGISDYVGDWHVTLVNTHEINALAWGLSGARLDICCIVASSPMHDSYVIERTRPTNAIDTWRFNSVYYLFQSLRAIFHAESKSQ